ncbi:NAD(P)/FAD-dependent oxidoreductase [Belliella marina]|uniref:NAD(P)/FAD-dependent oxidoreductase n=1 Tax=Belliella marina TaxID=1644146 RepID=A0ABW4VQM9_9BACT
MNSYDIIIIGGGLAGLIAANLLAKKQRRVLLIEKKGYPFHRVCGEYVSNEVRDFLDKEDLFPHEMDIADINTFQLTSVKGKSFSMPLDMGGFGISRYLLDDFLYKKSLSAGAEVLVNTQAEAVAFDSKADQFLITVSNGNTFECKHVIGAFGKRSKIDKALNRDFIKKRSAYIGVKYHIKTDLDPSTIALHNFEGGYCGINKIENDKFNLCYLGSRDQLRETGNIEEMERKFLWENPFLKRIWLESEFLFDRPEVINEINFMPKKAIENHMIMVGDAAGLITPLCGNGMAIAIHSGKLAAEAILTQADRKAIEANYLHTWSKYFKRRLWIGRKVQTLFGTKGASEFAVSIIKNSDFIARHIMKQTHGNPI